MHSTDPIATPKRQNAHERGFVHSYTQQRDLPHLCSHACLQLYLSIITLVRSIKDESDVSATLRLPSSVTNDTVTAFVMIYDIYKQGVYVNRGGHVR